MGPTNSAFESAGERLPAMPEKGNNSPLNFLGGVGRFVKRIQDEVTESNRTIQAVSFDQRAMPMDVKPLVDVGITDSDPTELLEY